MANIIPMIRSEIEQLERELENDPRHLKLIHLRALEKLYDGGGSAHGSPSDSPQPLKSRSPSGRGHKRAPEREQMFTHVDGFLTGKTTPTRTAEIREHLERIGFELPGKDLKKHLPSLIYNSDRYQSHGRDGWTLKVP